MHRPPNIVAFLAVTLLLTLGCSHTPGDAAYRGGHFEQAAKLYQKGARYDPHAALKLGLALEEERVSAATFGPAVYWFEKACELKSLPGCHNAGVAYERGTLGAAKDAAKAFDFYHRAADRGYMQSQYNLANLYATGLTNRDPIEGYTWMLLAQKAAAACRKEELCQWILEDPPGHKAKLAQRLNPDQIKHAESLAAGWKPKPSS